MTGSSERVRLRIRGRVQGVWYRSSVRERALALGLTGWVANRPDGSVELVAEGPRGALDALMEWCREGPSLARVMEIEAERGEARGEFSSFGVR